MRTLLFLLIAVSVALPTEVHSETERLNLGHAYPVLQVEGKVWIGTPTGLYQYNPDDDLYKRFGMPIGGASQNVNYLYHDDEWLWCVLDSGLAALHTRLNEWLVFTTENGLPSDTVNGLDFQDDYVWASTGDGAARFDLLIEEWEVYDQSRGIPAGSVKDILVRDENVWMIFEHGFSEYDPQFEKWRHYQVEQEPAGQVERGFFLGDELWLMSNGGLVRFDTELQTQQGFFQQYLTGSSLMELIIEDDTIWAITPSAIYYYESDSGVWREFEGNSYLKNTTLVDAYLDQSEIWILTDENVLVWDRTDKVWETVDYTSGLSTSDFRSAYVSGGMVFLLNLQGIDYRLSEEDNWRRHATAGPKVSTGAAGMSTLKNLFDNEEGGYIGLGEYKWSWEGSRIAVIYDYEQRFSDGEAEDPEVLSGERLDIKSQLLLGQSRSVSGYYNNVDYSETMYGCRYRGPQDGTLREFNWGDFRREPGTIPFGETASMFGSNIWLQTGPKTERFKRSLVTVTAYSGERRSQKTYECIKGALDEFSHSIFDVGYARNQFYAVSGIDTVSNLENFQIFVDDLTSSNNTSNTLVAETIAGVAGDFDLLYPTEDYYLYNKGNVVRLWGLSNSNSTIVATYTLDGHTVEEVLQYSDITSTARRNFYYLSAQSLMPYTFQLDIEDSSAQIVPLAQFGLDKDGDGIIDSRWIDYENGILFFPESEPFPAEVYGSEDPRSFYELHVDFQTELSLIQLEHNDLVRGSEIVELDGVEADGGDDYVLDYTNGTMVFVREGIVNTDTRIEIEYEYYVDEEPTGIHSASVNVSPSDDFYIQGDWLQFNPDAGGTSEVDSTANLLSAHSEIRNQIADYDVKLIPAIAYQTERNEITAGRLEGLISSPRLRFQTTYENYADGYSNLYCPQSVFGDVRTNLEAYASADLTGYLRLTGEWQDVRGFSQGGNGSPSDETGNLTCLFHRNNWPGWQLTYRNSRTQTESSTSEKSYIESRLEYQLNQAWAEKILLNAMKAEAFLRAGRQSGSLSAGVDKQQFLQGYVRLNADLSDRFQGSMFYRRNDLNDVSVESEKSPMTRAERLLLSLSHEEWQLVQMNLWVENNLDQIFHRNSSLKDARISQYSQLNLRMSPGEIWGALFPLYFEFSINQSLYGWSSTESSVAGWMWQLFRSSTDRLENSQVTRDYSIRNEFRPSPGWYLQSLLEWHAQETENGSSALESDYWRWSEELDVKVALSTRLNLGYTQYLRNMGYDRTTCYYQPSAWIEHRWAPNLLNTLYGSYRYTESDEGNIHGSVHDWEGRWDTILRRYNSLFIRRMEIRQSFSGSHTRAGGDDPERTYELTSSSSLDLYPLHSMILRLEFEAVQYADKLTPSNDYYDIALNLKMSLRF